MKKFLLQLIAFLAVTTAAYNTLSYVVRPVNVKDNSYMAAIADKHAQIARLHGPKLLFAGGSNLAFGLDSQAVEDTFHVPVVNLGLHGGLGLNFILNELESVIQPNDVVIFSIEYFMTANGDYALKQKTASFFKPASKFYTQNPLKELRFHLDKTRKNFRHHRRKSDDDDDDDHFYRREYFNEYGDIIIPAGWAKGHPDGVYKQYEYWSGIKKLNKFRAYAASKGVSVFFTYPCYLSSAFEKNRSAIEMLNEDLRRDLQIEILGDVQDFIFDDNFFLDTAYHLTPDGKQKRTQMLIDLIKTNPAAMDALDKASLEI